MGWVGFDLDGTLALDDRPSGFFDPTHIGDPVPKMAALVRDYLAQGIQVRIVTARACNPDDIPTVEQWLIRHFGQKLRVTNQKDYEMWLLYDDRAVAVEKNTGNTKAWETLFDRRK
jgi:hypothetical protein